MGCAFTSSAKGGSLLNADYLARGALAPRFIGWGLRPLTWMGLLRLVAGWPPDPDHSDPGAYRQPELLEPRAAPRARPPSDPPSGSRLIAAMAALLSTSRSNATSTGPSVAKPRRSA